MQYSKSTIFLLLALLCSSVFGFSQPKMAEVSGALQDFPAEQSPYSLNLKAYDPLTAAWVSVQSTADAGGKFSARIPVYFVQQLFLEVGGEQISFLAGPEAKVEISLIYQKPATFTGEMADWNNRMQTFSRDMIAAKLNHDEVELLGSDTEIKQQWKAQCASEEARDLKWANKYLKKTKAPADFVDWVNADIHFKYAELERKMVFGERIDLPWKDIQAWITEKNLNGGKVENAIFVEHAFRLLQNFYGSVSTQLKNKGVSEETTFITATLDSINHVYSGFVREAMLSNVFMGLSRQVTPSELPWLKDRWSQYLKDFSMSPLRQEVERLAELRKTTDPSFDEVIAKHRGKVVLIDCWATWCGPCRVQLPFMHTLKDSLAGEDVDFVYFSFDRDQQKWKDFLQKEQLMGEHYLLQGGRLANDVQQRFNVSGIPRYMLIDKEGNVTNPNAPRPGTISPERQWVFNPVLLAEIRKMLEK